MLKRLPYPGIRAFARDESDLFFGRETCVDAMVDRLGATRFLAVLGPSGSGKSSLVRTGLLDALDLGLLAQYGSQWKLADFSPGTQPIRNLATALIEATTDASDETAVGLLSEHLANGPRSVIEWASSGNLESGCNLLIMVDQFEELFRYGDYSKREEAEAFVATLLESVSYLGFSIHVVITMRSEYLGACAAIPGLAERISAGLYLAPRMERDECREAIEGPAAVIGFKVEAALVNRMLNDLASFAPWQEGEGDDPGAQLARQADQLPLMQHVLNRLWLGAQAEAVGGPVELKLKEYEQLGGLSGALDAHGAEVIAGLGGGQLGSIQTVFRALVSGNSLATAVRRPCRMGELIDATGGKRDGIVAIVEAFSAQGCNFLRTSDPSLASDAVIVDISHESLIRQWTPLRQWLELEIRDGAMWRRLVSAEERYRAGEGGLLTGLDYQSSAAWWESASPCEAWADRNGGRFEAVHTYLAESRQAEGARADIEKAQQLRERNRLRGFVAGLALALLIFVALAITDYLSNQRLNATKVRLEMESQRELNAVTAAKAEEKRTASVLNDVSNTVDHYKGVIGAGELESDLMKTLAPYQKELSERTKALDEENVARDDYRRGFLFETIGDARQAMASYAVAYDEGRKAISTERSLGHPLSESLQKDFIKNGCRYAWFLLDIGNDRTGGQVLQQMRDFVGQYNLQASAQLLIAYSEFENVESRFSRDHEQLDEEKRHSLAAFNLTKRAIATSRSKTDLETRELEFTIFRNQSLDAKGTEQQILLAGACKIADQLIAESPLDSRSIKARVDCLQDQAWSARRSGKYDDAASKIRIAEETAYTGLRADPREQSLLLSLASLEGFLADVAWVEHKDSLRFAHATSAEGYIVRAISGRTLFQTYPTEIKDLYESCCKSLDSEIFPNSDFELAYYRNIAEAVAPTLDAFPKAPSFAYVAADASVRMAKAMKADTSRNKEAEGYLTKAIDWFDKSGAIHNLASFSDGFSTYCGTYPQLIRLRAATGHLDLMLLDIKKMNSICAPALNRYPWDIYLRSSFTEDAEIAGQALFDVHRYKEAVPYLEYSSHWVGRDSSLLLARMYREGLGVRKEEKKAKELEALALGQRITRYTIPVDFGGIKAPFYFYVRDWPSDYPVEYRGIDDQVKWLKEARGGTVPPEVIDSFHKLMKIAVDNKVSFRELVEYALSTTDQSTPPSDSTAGHPNDRAKPQYDLAQSLLKQEKWADAAQAAENALTVDPDSTDVLGLAEGIYHDRLFMFDRAFELNRRRVELGSGVDDFVEKHLTTGRFESCADLAAVVRDESSDKRIRLIMSSIDFACLSAEQKHDAALVAGRQLRKELAGLEKVRWTFTGTEHFIGGSPAFSDRTPAWISLFEALQKGDEKGALTALSALGIPEQAKQAESEQKSVNK